MEILSECQPWMGPRDRDGYGKSSGRRAHRMAWEQAHGPIPAGLCVLHRCDNPPCVNIDHLFLGTHIDNVRDRDAKGRTARGDRHMSRTRPEALRRGASHPRKLKPELYSRGERHPSARLRDVDVISIRRRYATGGVTQQALGDEYGVSQRTVSLIVLRQKWAHLEDAE